MKPRHACPPLLWHFPAGSMLVGASHATCQACLRPLLRPRCQTTSEISVGQQRDAVRRAQPQVLRGRAVWKNWIARDNKDLQQRLRALVAEFEKSDEHSRRTRQRSGGHRPTATCTYSARSTASTSVSTSPTSSEATSRTTTLTAVPSSAGLQTRLTRHSQYRAACGCIAS